MPSRPEKRAGTSTNEDRLQARSLVGVQVVLFVAFGIYAMFELVFNYKFSEALNGAPSANQLTQLVDSGKTLAAIGMALLFASFWATLNKHAVYFRAIVFGVLGYFFGVWIQETIATQILDRLPTEFKEKAATSVYAGGKSSSGKFSFVTKALQSDADEDYATQQLKEMVALEANVFVAGLASSYGTKEEKIRYLLKQAISLGRAINQDEFQNERDFVAMTWFAYAAFVNPHPKYQIAIENTLFERYGLHSGDRLRDWMIDKWGSSKYDTYFHCRAIKKKSKSYCDSVTGLMGYYEQELPLSLSIYGLRNKTYMEATPRFIDFKSRVNIKKITQSPEAVYQEYMQDVPKKYINGLEVSAVARVAGKDLFDWMVSNHKSIYAQYGLGLKSLDIPTDSCESFYSHPEVKSVMQQWSRWMFFEDRKYFSNADFCKHFDLDYYYNLLEGVGPTFGTVYGHSPLDVSMWKKHVVGKGYLFLPQESLWRYRRYAKSDGFEGDAFRAISIGRTRHYERYKLQQIPFTHQLDRLYYTQFGSSLKNNLAREHDSNIDAVKVFFPEAEIEKLNYRSFKEARFDVITKIRLDQIKNGIEWPHFEEYKEIGRIHLGLDDNVFDREQVKNAVRDTYAGLLVGISVAFLFSVTLLITTASKAIVGVFFVRKAWVNDRVSKIYCRSMNALTMIIPAALFGWAYSAGGEGLALSFGLQDEGVVVKGALLIVGNIYEHGLSPLHDFYNACVEFVTNLF